MNCPVMATERFVWPCWPLLGLTWVIAGPPVTVNAFAKMTTSEPLLTVRVRVPVAAAAPIES